MTVRMTVGDIREEVKRCQHRLPRVAKLQAYPDDTSIWAIGPREQIGVLLTERGVQTIGQLAETSLDDLIEMLRDATCVAENILCLHAELAKRGFPHQL